VYKGGGRDLLNIGKAEKDHRPGSLQSAIFFFLPYGETLEKISPACIFMREKFYKHIHI
jgi:hypothetical protein